MEPTNTQWRKREREVMIPLTQDELLERGSNVAKLWSDARAIETALKAYSKIEKGKIEELEQIINKDLKCIETGKEPRTLEVDEKLDFAASLVEYFLDGVKVDERTMDAAERQLGFELVPGNKAEEPDDGLSPQTVFELFPTPKEMPAVAVDGPAPAPDETEPAPANLVGKIETVLPTSRVVPEGVTRLERETIDDKGRIIRSSTEVVTVKSREQETREKIIGGGAD
jgi:hypothetical protein